MAEFPAMPLWTDAYLGDTTHFTTMEHGAYVLLLIAMWRSGQARLPADEALLCRISRARPEQWRHMRPTLFAPKFLEEHNGYITQGRLTDEWDAIRQNSKRQSSKAKSRWLKNKENRQSGATPLRASSVTPLGQCDAHRSGLKSLKNNGSDNAAAMPGVCRSDASLTLTLNTKVRERANNSTPAKLSPPKSNGKKPRTRPLPSDWKVPQGAIDEAIRLHVDWRTEEAKCRDWLKATGKQYVDYDAFFRNWIKRAAEKQPRIAWKSGIEGVL